MKTTKNGLWMMMLIGTFMVPVHGVHACTEILVRSKDSSVVNVRSMEFEVDLKSVLNIQPRGELFTSITPDSTPGLQWKNKYGYVYMNAMGYPVALDGLNEAGLSFGALYLPNYAVYQTIPPGENNKALWNLDFGSWVLGNFSTVEEVKRALGSVYVIQAPSIGVSPLHYNITDATGKSVIIEYTADGVNVYDNNVGVLTNSPPYPWHIANLCNYLNLSPANPKSMTINGESFAPIGQGAGLIGLPGDWSPPSRFIKSAAMTLLSLPAENASEAINLALHFINNVDIPIGVSSIVSNGTKEYDHTQWIVVRDLTNRKYMFRSYDNLQLRSVDITKLDLSEGAKSIIIPITGGDAVFDITEQYNR